MFREYDLDNVNISPRIYNTWVGMLTLFVRDLQAKYPDLQSTEIPDEIFRVNTITGIGEIRVVVRTTVCKLKVPKEEYELTK